jgi:DNA mismatch endonuclease (patch repair protein)
LVRKSLFSMGLRYRKNDKRYPGRPDIVLPKHKAAIFVNGCFWHAHEGCPHFRMPKSRPEYWEPKLEKNKARDILNAQKLREEGWNVIYVWECELEPDKLEERLERLYEEITGKRLGAPEAEDEPVNGQPLAIDENGAEAPAANAREGLPGERAVDVSEGLPREPAVDSSEELPREPSDAQER